MPSLSNFKKSSSGVDGLFVPLSPLVAFVPPVVDDCLGDDGDSARGVPGVPLSPPSGEAPPLLGLREWRCFIGFSSVARFQYQGAAP